MAIKKLVRKIAEAFKELEAAMNLQSGEMDVTPFSQACSFKFTKMDYVAKKRNRKIALLLYSAAVAISYSWDTAAAVCAVYLGKAVAGGTYALLQMNTFEQTQ